jgi:uracil phosphoribosyltransferase
LTKARLLGLHGTMPDLHVLAHPIAQVCLTQLRDMTTTPERFRIAMQRLSALVFVEASAGMNLQAVDVQTPLTTTKGAKLARPVILVPILRAGLGMIDGILSLVPDAVVAHVGIARDEETAKPHSYYAKLPQVLASGEVFLLDPMLATGGSAVEAARQLKAAGVKSLRLVGVVACPQGVETFHAAHPDVPIYTASVDEGLNDRSYIVPGLGDAGDRYFGT